MRLNVCMQPMSQPTTSSAPRYLLKNVDSFAGFGHCVGTFIAGITIAHRHGLQLIHRPLAAAHGLGYSFGDYFMSDGLVVPPVVTPTFATSDGALWVDGRRTSIYVLADRSSMKADASSIQEAAKELPADTILWLRKGRFSLQEDDPTAAPVAQRYAGLWLRERYWQAFAARSAAAHGPATATVAASPAARPIRVVVHVRRGDVPYIGPKTGLPHPHFVETTAILEVLRGCRDAIGADAWPTVQLDIETERGWLANDTAAVRALHAGARVNMGDDRRPHLAVEAMMRMSAADLFVMGSSGFSGWAAVFGCGVKVGPWPGKSMGTPFSRRHVPFKNSLTTRVEPFARRALPALQVAWAEYVACRSDAACDLCGASHVHEPRWAQSPLARALVDDPRATQWQRPPLLPPTAAELAASGRGAAASSGGGGAGVAAGEPPPSSSAAWRQMWRECAPGRGLEAHVSCMRGKWIANLTAFVHARRRMPRCAHASIGGRMLVSHLCANVSGAAATTAGPKATKAKAKAKARARPK